MADVRILIGGESFREIREGGYYYVDKTDFVRMLLARIPGKAVLITRPRRFGKTLTLSMLRDFLDITQESSGIFAGLSVSQDKELCGAWMNKCPTILLSLKDVDGESFEEAYGSFLGTAARLCEDHAYLQDSPEVLDSTKRVLRAIQYQTAERYQVADLLITLCRALNQRYKKKVVVLIDEYDVPLARAQENGYYGKMLKFVRKLLESVLKSNPALEFGLMTGCLRMAKESSYTGLNNVKCFGISDAFFADKIGFTKREVEQILADADFSSKEDEVRTWYDGYCFGEHHEMYCPWDVLQYVDDLQHDPGAQPLPYWLNSGENSEVRKCVGRTDLDIDDDVSELLQGQELRKEINEYLTYGEVDAREQSLWTLLYLTGYLTGSAAEQLDSGHKVVALRIPNKEVHAVFQRAIGEWYRDQADEASLQALYDALWSMDEKDMTDVVSDLMMEMISYHDYKEAYYHAIMAGLLRGKYTVTSNYESGLGRADIRVENANNNRAAVIEVKHASSEESMEQLTKEALQQIREEKYDAPLVKKYGTVLHWGMTFYKKSCLAMCEKYTG